MAAKPKKLKVYQAQFGFHDSVVAAANQAAALKAWGVRQNLFAEGQADLSQDPQAIDAALKHPETPLRRTVGSGRLFELDPTDLPKAPKVAKTLASAAHTAATKTPERPKPVVDRSALSAAEAVLKALEDHRRQEEASFRRREEQLAAEAAKAQSSYVADRRKAEAAVDGARKRYVDAGGK